MWMHQMKVRLTVERSGQTVRTQTLPGIGSSIRYVYA